MPVINRIAELHPEITAWRHDFHSNPELLFDVHRTAGIVAEKLKAFGVDEVVTGIGRTGVVGIIKGRNPGNGKVIGLRADMDALPIHEETGLPYASRTAGKMHACGHDGHTAMLLGAARYLAETRNFSGTAVMIFQPAEEGGGGGREMVKDGMMDRFGIQEVYGMHNMPGIPIGHFAIRPGPLMAGADRFDVTLTGKGGHAAMPHVTRDPVVAMSQIIIGLQSIVSRNLDPLQSMVLSVTAVSAGEAFNVIPQTARFRGTVRTLTDPVRDLAENRFRTLVDGIAAAHGIQTEIYYERGYPVTVNDPERTDFAVNIAQEIVGESQVDPLTRPLMGSEDFSFMLNERPGAYIFLGNGDTAGVHHPAYDFNDAAIPYGVSFFVRAIERGMPA